VRAERLLPGLCALTVLGAVLSSAEGTEATFSGTTSNAVNTITGKRDWLPPQVTAAVAVKTQGGITGVVGWGQQVVVYAAIAENPDSPSPSGIASVSAGITGVTSLSMSPGTGSMAGVSYTYLSAPVLVPVGAPSGFYAGWVEARDVAGNVSAPLPAGITIDGAAPAATSPSLVNGTGITGRPDAGDVLTYRWTENGVMDPHSVIRGWDGAAPRDVTVRIVDDATCACELLTIRDTAGDAVPALGSLDLGPGSDYVTGSATFGTSLDRSRVAWTTDKKGFVVTLGALADGTVNAAVTAATHTWTPGAAAFDHGGNPSTTTPVAEPSPLDQDF
jgi:hypothetical protein